MPPFGVFASEFLILTTAMKQQPWATPILLVALGVAFAAIFGRVQSMVFGAPTGAGCRTSRHCCPCSRISRSCCCSGCTSPRTWPSGIARQHA